jgi:hypothetical protein
MRRLELREPHLFQQKATLCFLLPKLLRFWKCEGAIESLRLTSVVWSETRHRSTLCLVSSHFKHFNTHMNVGDNGLICDFVRTTPQHLTTLGCRNGSFRCMTTKSIEITHLSINSLSPAQDTFCNACGRRHGNRAPLVADDDASRSNDENESNASREPIRTSNCTKTMETQRITHTARRTVTSHCFNEDDIVPQSLYIVQK